MKKISFGILAAMLLLIVGVYAHGGNWFDGISMHDEVEEVLESGTFKDLEKLREEYGMPILHWIYDAEDFEIAQQFHEESESSPNRRFGGCHW
jgi:hypothetical protein